MRWYRRDLRHRPYAGETHSGFLMPCNRRGAAAANLPRSMDNRAEKTLRITKHKLNHLREKLDM